jgi:hypothetical protein
VIRWRRGEHTGRDTLDTTTARETTDGGLGDTLDVVTKNLAVTLGSALAEALSALSAWGDVSERFMKRKEARKKYRSLWCCWVVVRSGRARSTIG